MWINRAPSCRSPSCAAKARGMWRPAASRGVPGVALARPLRPLLLALRPCWCRGTVADLLASWESE